MSMFAPWHLEYSATTKDNLRVSVIPCIYPYCTRASVFVALPVYLNYFTYPYCTLAAVTLSALLYLQICAVRPVSTFLNSNL